MNLINLTAQEIKTKVLNLEISPLDIVEQFLNNIEQKDKTIGAFAHIDREYAEICANDLEIRLKKGEKPALAGIPIAIKDNISRKGYLTTCCSLSLKDYKGVYDATVVSKLREAGAIIVGTTNMDEFAMGSSCENSALHPTKNPWDLNYSPGGSSGGSAACVAGGLVPLSLGSDTGGSIRQPASLCGVLGLKPSYGRVSRYGLVAFASSLDQIGSFARNYQDLNLLTEVISGYDKKDSTSVQKDLNLNFDKDKTITVGIPEEYFSDGLNTDVRIKVEEALDYLTKNANVKTIPISLPSLKYAIATYYVIATAEASSNLGRYDGMHYGTRFDGENLTDSFCQSRTNGFGDEVQRRIMLGSYVLSSGYYDAYYVKALKVRRLIANDFQDAFTKCDVIIGPTSPIAGLKLNEDVDDPMSKFLLDIYTVSANLVGLPGLSVPCGFGDKNHPIGLQIIGNSFDEACILELARRFENAGHNNKIAEIA